MAFLTDKAAKEKIAGLEVRNAELEADCVTRDEEISRLQTDLATANENLSTATADLNQARADLATANSTIEANAEKVRKAEEQEATFADRVEAAGLAKFQALGGSPIEEAKSKDDAATSITRAEFQAMTPAARTAFSKAGGQLKG